MWYLLDICDCDSVAVPPGRVVTTINCVPPAVLVPASFGTVVMILVGVPAAVMPAPDLGAAMTMVCLPGVPPILDSPPMVLAWLIMDVGTVLIIVVLPGI